jgi:hypothetical protein
MNATGLHFSIPRLGFSKYKGLVIFRSTIHEELSVRGDEGLVLPIATVIMCGSGINMRSRIDFLTRPIRILGKKKIGRCKK